MPHPRGEIQAISPHRHTPTGEPQTTCAGALGRNSTNFAPPKKEKNFGGAKFMSLTQTASSTAIRQAHDPGNARASHEAAQRICGGVERLHVAEWLRHSDGKRVFGETRLRAPPLLFPQRNAQNTPDHLCCGHDQLGVLSWRVETLSESCIFSILAGLYRGAIVQLAQADQWEAPLDGYCAV